MTNSIDVAWSLPEALDAINSEVMNSSFENNAVEFVQGQSKEVGWTFLNSLLTHPRANTRTLGLRVVRRQIRDSEILERVIDLCFSVERLAELQHWYKAILSRYPTLRFALRLKAEILSRSDIGFTERHIRALQMHNAHGSKAKKLALMKLLEASATLR